MLGLLSVNGCKSRQIETQTIQMDIESRFWVRVLLLRNVDSCTLTSASPLSVGKDRSIPAAQTAEIRIEKVGVPINVKLLNGSITIADQTFAGKEVVVFPDDPYIFNLNGSDYRGNLRLIVNPNGKSFDAINLVPPEPYLAGVVGAEMPDYWEAEALKAQAIAARTYCFYIKKRFGVNRTWDVKQTEASQVYRGINAESTRVWKAVNETKGQVLTCKQTDGTQEVFPSYYSSTCGGHTENSRNVFGDTFESLTGVPCPYCETVAKPKFFFWPMIKFDKDEVADRLFRKYPTLKKLGEITNISPAGWSDYEDITRLTKIRIVGSNGKSDFLKAEDFRLTVDPTGRKLKSSICQIVDWDNYWAFLSGRGWGHGVGMCQYGAEGMAREGKNVEQIISYYYPASRTKIMY
jgi:stage II sporulation protein D